MNQQDRCWMVSIFAISLMLTISLMPICYAQDQSDAFMLEEITVTAEKREASIQKTPISITAVTGENVREMGKYNADEVLKNVPGVIIQRAARGYVIAIRGLGSDLPPGVGESSVSTNYDGVYYFRAEGGMLGFYDLERVEVLRGPQGTLYGRNATAGVVNVISKDPSDRFEGYGTVEVGSYSLLRTEGAVNVPISNDLSARMAFVNVHRDGYLSNGQDDAVGSAARMKVRYEPDDEFKLVLSSEYTRLGGKGPGRGDYDEYLSGDPYVSMDDCDNLWQNYESYKFSANAQFTAGPGTVTFIPSYMTADGEVMQWRQSAYRMTLDPVDAESVAAELRYASKSDAKIQWVGGLYYIDYESGSKEGDAALQTSFTTSYAAFGQITLPMTNSLRGIVGSRIGYDEKSYHSIDLDPISSEADWTSFDWKVGIEKDISERVMTYLTLASGHRPGGFNSSVYSGELAGTSFDQEELVSAELGLKSRFFSQRMQLNANIFFYDYDNYQVTDFYVEGGEPVLVYYNAGAVENYGAEFETEMLLTDRTIGKFSLTYLSSEYQDDFILHGGMPSHTLNLKGCSLPHSPEWTTKFGIEHTFGLGSNGYLTPSFELSWTDGQLVGVFPEYNSVQDSYMNYDASVRYKSADDTWSINLYGKNIGDETYLMEAKGTGAVRFNSPRTVGVVVSAKF